MKLSINTVKLKEMVARAVKGASCDKIQPITGLICIQYKKNTFTLITTNGTDYLYINDKSVKGKNFYIVVQVEQFSKLVSRITSESVTLEVKDGVLEVVGNGTYSIEIPLDENGEFITYPDPLDSITLDFTDQLKLTTIHTILDTIKPSLAVTMEMPVITRYFVGDSVVATDSCKAAGYNVKVFNSEILITPQLMNLLDVMTAETIDVMITDNNLVFSSEDCVIYSTPMPGIEEYPIDIIENLLTEEFQSVCKVNKNDFSALLDRMSLFVGAYDDNTIRLTFTNDGISVTNMNSKSTEVIEYIDSKNFTPFTCLIDIDSLFTQVKVYTSDAVELQYGNDSSIKLVDGDVTQVICLSEET